MKYKCSDQACGEIFNSFKSIVNHRTSAHTNERIEFLKLSLSAQTSINQWNTLKYEIVPSEGTVIVDSDNNKIRFKRKEDTHSRETPNNQNDHESCESSDSDEKKKKLLDRLSLFLPDACSYLVKNDDIHAERIVNFIELLATGKFPLNNICWLVFSDLI